MKKPKAKAKPLCAHCKKKPCAARVRTRRKAINKYCGKPCRVAAADAARRARNKARYGTTTRPSPKRRRRTRARR